MSRIILFVFVFSLMLCGQSMAAREVFTSPISNFSVDVPDDWKAKAIGNGCQLDSRDGKNSMTIQFSPAGAMSHKEVAKTIAEKTGMHVDKESSDDKAAWLDGDIKGMPTGILAVKNDPIYLISIWGGADRATMRKIYDSIKSTSEERQEMTLELEAGPIWNNDYARKRCPEVLDAWLKANPGKNAEWHGEWTTKVEGKMSVCVIKVKN